MIPVHRLRRHPVAITCEFEHSLVLTWAAPADLLASLVAPGLEVDRDDGGWGFLAVAIVQVANLRPLGLPALVGGRFTLVGYRVFVRHRDPSGRERRGLHILRSDTDRRSMAIGGNLLTHYRYRLATIDVTELAGALGVRVRTPDGEADLDLVAHLDAEPAPLPTSSPFPNEQVARRYAGPLPWTFDHEPETGSIVMVHGRRSSWAPHPVAVDIGRCTFVDRPPFVGADVRLANAFHVAGIDYGWDRGICVPIGDAP